VAARRFLQPNGASDPRWGYLDKFDVNPYLARSLAIAALAAVVAVAVPLLWRQAAPVPRPVIVFDRPIDIQPLPEIRSEWPRITPPVVRRNLVAQDRKPVPAQIEPIELDVPATTGAAGTAATDLPLPEGEWDAPIGSGSTAGAWPDPDEFVPFEAPPVLVSMPEPAYPEIARDAGIEGAVLVRVLVGADGFVHRVVLVDGVVGLDEAAFAAATAAVFRAARQQDRPVAVWVVIPIEFRLRD